MFYNTNFDVKYFDISRELKQKKTTENSKEYTVDDIDIISHKLYQDELSSVFYAEDILDDKIDIGIRKMLELLKKNVEINYALEEMRLLLLDKNDNYNTLDDNTREKDEHEYLLFIILFSYHVFYLMHKIICLQLNGNDIPDDMIDQLKVLVTNVLTNNI